MSLLCRGICLIAGHNWITIKKDYNIWVRECTFCGKVETIRLV